VEGAGEMNASHLTDVGHVKHILQSFLGLFNDYSDEISGTHQQDRLDALRGQLQTMEAEVTHYLLQILGDGIIVTGSFGIRRQIAHRDLLATALMGGNNEMSINFYDYKTTVTSLLNRALGAIETGLWPRKEPKPVLVIRDNILKERCSDLLKAPGNFDRVIREATTILEDRLRNKVPHDILAKLIPIAAEQTGDTLINKLCSPNNPVLKVSSEKHERIAFHRILLGVISYLRNPHHHKINDTTEWSWAWSTVGLIDKLLADIESCVVCDQTHM